jgi:predicted ribosomally synthesized peptide with nif11-like leader
MSIQAVQDFLQAVSTDEALQNQLASAMDASNDRAAVAELANRNGYDFTPDELWQEIQARQSTIEANNETQLSDEELEAVAGGSFFGIPTITIATASMCPSLPTGPVIRLPRPKW